MNVSILWLLLQLWSGVVFSTVESYRGTRLTWPLEGCGKRKKKKKSNSRFSSLRKREHMNHYCFLLDGQISSKEFKRGSKPQGLTAWSCRLSLSLRCKLSYSWRWDEGKLSDKNTTHTRCPLSVLDWWKKQSCLALGDSVSTRERGWALCGPLVSSFLIRSEASRWAILTTDYIQEVARSSFNHMKTYFLFFD